MTASLWKPGLVLSDIEGEAVVVEEYAIATAGQTVFNLTSLVYPVGAGQLRVFKNGTEISAYTETSSTRVTLNSGAVAGDRLAFILVSTNQLGAASLSSQVAAAKAASDSAIYHAGLVAGMATKAGIQNQSYNYGVSSTTADSMAITLSPVISAYTAGLRVTVVNSIGANTITSPTINVNGLGAKLIKKRDVSGAAINLEIGELKRYAPYDLIYSAFGYFELVGDQYTTPTTVPDINIYRQALGVI